MSELSNSFFHAATFDSEYLQLGIPSSEHLVHAKFTNFQFKTMFGGERYIYFVDVNDNIIYFVGDGDGNYELEVSSLNTIGNQLFKKYELKHCKKITLHAKSINFKKDYPDFIPLEYYRNCELIFIVDITKTKILRLLHDKQPQLFSFVPRIKEIVTGPLATHFLIIDENHELWDLSKNDQPVKIEFPNENVKVKCGGAWNNGYLMIDFENRIYTQENGNHVRSGLGLTGDFSTELNYIPNPLEKNHIIEKVAGGFYHVFFKTREEKVLACGYDNLDQVTFGLVENNRNNEENNLTECPFEFGECIEFGGFSRGEYIINSKNDVYCISEMFSTFTHKPIQKYPMLQIFNLNELSSVAGIANNELKYNAVVNTGWQCCFFHNPNKVVKRSKWREKLFQSYRNSKLIDITIYCLEDL